MSRVPSSDHGDGGHDLRQDAHAADDLVGCGVVRDQPEDSASALGLQRVLGLGSYQTAWTMLHKLRRAMVRPDRDRLAGDVEVDESYVGGGEEGVAGRLTHKKAVVAIAVELHQPRGFGRARLRRIPDVSATSLVG